METGWHPVPDGKGDKWTQGMGFSKDSDRFDLFVTSPLPRSREAEEELNREAVDQFETGHRKAKDRRRGL